MFLESLIALLLGVLTGTFTGLVPGVHTNMVAVFLLSLSAYLLDYVSGLFLAVFIVAMAITHTFLDNIPSIFLGAPEPGTILAVLPGHRMLMKGKGYEAVRLSTLGSLGGLVLAVILIPLAVPFVAKFFPYLQAYMGWIILLIVLVMIIKEKKKVLSLFIFLLSGALGLIVLNFPGLKQPLFPLLSGMFGLATLIISLKEKVNIPKQDLKGEIKIKKSTLGAAIGVSALSGGLVSLLPGVGASEASVLGNEITGRRLGDKGFLVLVGGTNTVNMAVSLLTFFALDKPRNGAIVVVKEIIKSITFNQLLVFLAAALVAGSMATLLTLFFSKKFSYYISKINYQKLCKGIIVFVALLVFLLTGWQGFLVMITSTALGLLPALLGVRRALNMGCLLLPVILWFLL